MYRPQIEIDGSLRTVAYRGYFVKRKRLRMDPCGTPHLTLAVVENFHEYLHGISYYVGII